MRRNKDGPFFCYAPFTTPHLELAVPEDSLAEYRGKFPETPYIDERRHYADQPHPRAAYAAMITRMDRDVGRILALLKELKLEDNTVVFFASDNGAAQVRRDSFFRSTGPFRGAKGDFYEGGIRTPLIARWPGKIRAGATNDHACAAWDFLPTAAEFAGVRAPKGIDGVSIVPALLGKKQPRHEFLYWERPRHNAADGTFRQEIPIQGMRMGEWKAVRTAPAGPLELFNLKDDIGEKRNLAAESPRVMARIEEYLRAARTVPRFQKQPQHHWSPETA
ncbi:MAG: sulfatase-like hydrolase/transferase [Verrucomicrobiales bacterium]|nr:sulfatase-like hydrolase/transferase [Verrucomicrobiales bacterium]